MKVIPSLGENLPFIDTLGSDWPSNTVTGMYLSPAALHLLAKPALYLRKLSQTCAIWRLCRRTAHYTSCSTLRATHGAHSTTSAGASEMEPGPLSQTRREGDQSGSASRQTGLKVTTGPPLKFAEPVPWPISLSRVPPLRVERGPAARLWLAGPYRRLNGCVSAANKRGSVVHVKTSRAVRTYRTQHLLAAMTPPWTGMHIKQFQCNLWEPVGSA